MVIYLQSPKIIIPLVSLAIILPAIGFMSINLSDNIELETTDKSIATMKVSKIQRAMPEIINESNLIIDGTILSTETISQKLDPESTHEMIFTVAKVQVNEVLKGKTNSDIVYVQMFGGETAETIVEAPRLDVRQNDSVIMILSSDPDAKYLNGNYGLTDWDYGIFLKDGVDAKSFGVERSIPYDDLKNAIKSGK